MNHPDGPTPAELLMELIADDLKSTLKPTEPQTMFKHIQLAVNPDSDGTPEAMREIRFAFATFELYGALYLCLRTLERLERITPDEVAAIDAARYALTAATGEEP